VLPGDDLLQRQDADALLVRGPVGAMDDLVARLVGAGVAVRELAPVVAPLEAAFLALTGTADADQEQP
jgi:ABC-2 type transport system ATP-binding protein